MRRQVQRATTEFMDCSGTRRLHIVDCTRALASPHGMRVVQVANFYGPRSGGLRTAVDRLGAEYCAAGHEVFLIVPGPRAERSRLPTGVVRITLPARLIPFTGGYRAVMPGPVQGAAGSAATRRLGGLGPAHA